MGYLYPLWAPSYKQVLNQLKWWGLWAVGRLVSRTGVYVFSHISFLITKTPHSISKLRQEYKVCALGYQQVAKNELILKSLKPLNYFKRFLKVLQNQIAELKDLYI